MKSKENSKIMVWFSGAMLVGFTTVLFIALKLFGIISWSWWWVLCPVWIPWALLFALTGVGIILGLILIMSAMGRTEEDE